MSLVLPVARCVLRVFSMVISCQTSGKLPQSWGKVRRRTGVRRAPGFRVLRCAPGLFTRFRRFSSFFGTFHQEFPCCRVRSLAIFVIFGQLFTRHSPVAGSVRWQFLSFLGNFCHVILLLKGPSIAHFCHFCRSSVLKFHCSRLRLLALRALLLEFASVASEI